MKITRSCKLLTRNALEAGRVSGTISAAGSSVRREEVCGLLGSPEFLLVVWLALAAGGWSSARAEAH